jgi:H+/Cl- antiporter ClcA
VLDRLPAWLRHALVIFGGTLIGVVAPALAAHQDDVSLWLVTTMRLPVWVLPFVATIVGSLILRLTTLTRQYGVGSTTPPAVPVIDPATGPDAPTGGGMAD